MSEAAPQGTAPSADDNAFAVLLAVQDLDTSISQHEHRKASLPERRELDALQYARHRNPPAGGRARPPRARRS